jgi:hypothetical protein
LLVSLHWELVSSLTELATGAYRKPVYSRSRDVFCLAVNLFMSISPVPDAFPDLGFNFLNRNAQRVQIMRGLIVPLPGRSVSRFGCLYCLHLQGE